MDIPDGVNQLLCAEVREMFEDVLQDCPEDVVVVWYSGDTMSCASTLMSTERFVYMCEAAKAAALTEE